MSSIIIDRDSFGKVIVRRRNIDWLSGVWFVDPRTRVGLEFMTLRSRTWPYWVNGYLSYISRMVSSKPSLRGSILARKCCLWLFGNLVICIFGQV
jgi:hypothetical protein